ncbi:MAG: hypothetical protein RIT45_4315 [Pseudomonadota bacterium]
MRNQLFESGWRSWRTAVAILATLATASVGVPGCGSEEATPKPKYEAQIRWTEGGIPHIEGATFGDAGFGAGYAYATLNVCLLADQIVKVNSRRAATFGPGTLDSNVESDFFQHFLGVRSKAEEHWDKVHPDVQALLEGYAAGYNQYLLDTGPAGLPERCRGADWVQPVTALDMFTYVMDLAMVASSRALPSLGPVKIWAQPPKQTTAADPVARSPQLALAPLAGRHPIGSNGIAIGKDKSENGRGMVLGNPHFPWAGELRFWQLHLTVPGKYDVAGAGLSGSPIPNIGYNADLAWTHTVSKSMKFTAYRLQLVEGKPTSYLYDGQERPMSEHVFDVQVKKEDGTFETRSRTYYRSHYGPVVAIAGLADWTTKTAFTIRDANADNHALLEHFLRVGQAHSVSELESVMASVQANPWVNTIAADRAGNAFYAESNSVPNLSDATYAAHQKAVDEGDTLAQILAGYGIFVLDGSTSATEWAEEAGSREPGLVPWTKTPHATRPDYLANANESYWLSHVAQPLPPAAPIFGDRETARTLRTRVVLHEATDIGAGSAAGEDGKFNVAELASIPFRCRVLSADLALAGALDYCKTHDKVAVSGEDVDIKGACAALAGWDGRNAVDSKGAIVWRETMASFVTSLSEHLLWDEIFAVPFDPKSPLTTPNTAVWADDKGAPSKLALALGTAAKRLAGAGIPADAALGDWQFLPRGKDKLPVPGGMGPLGAFNIAGYSPGRDSSLYPTIAQTKVVNDTTDLTDSGYVVNYGSSFMMAVTFDDNGPVGQQILTYSQSSEPDSPHFRDQTEHYGKGRWYAIRYAEAEIAASPELKTQTVRAAP